MGLDFMSDANHCSESSVLGRTGWLDGREAVCGAWAWAWAWTCGDFVWAANNGALGAGAGGKGGAGGRGEQNAQPGRTGQALGGAS